MAKMKLKIPVFKNLTLKPFTYIKFFQKLSNKYDLEFYDTFDDCRWNSGRVYTSTLTINFIIFLKKLKASFSFVFTNDKIIKDSICFNQIDKIHKAGINISFIIRDKNYDFFKKLKNKYNAKLILSITDSDNIIKNDSENINKYLNYINELIKSNKYDYIVLKNEILLFNNFKEIIKDRIDKFIIIYNFNFECLFCPFYKEHHQMADYQNLFNEHTKKVINNCPLDENIINQLDYTKTSQYINNLKQFNYYKFTGRHTDFKNVKNNIQRFLNENFI